MPPMSPACLLDSFLIWQSSFRSSHMEGPSCLSKTSTRLSQPSSKQLKCVNLSFPAGFSAISSSLTAALHLTFVQPPRAPSLLDAISSSSLFRTVHSCHYHQLSLSIPQSLRVSIWLIVHPPLGTLQCVSHISFFSSYVPSTAPLPWSVNLAPQSTAHSAQFASTPTFFSFPSPY